MASSGASPRMRQRSSSLDFRVRVGRSRFVASYLFPGLNGARSCRRRGELGHAAFFFFHGFLPPVVAMNLLLLHVLFLVAGGCDYERLLL